MTVEASGTAVLTCHLCGRPRPALAWRGPNSAMVMPGHGISLVYADDGTASLHVNILPH